MYRRYCKMFPSAFLIALYLLPSLLSAFRVKGVAGKYQNVALKPTLGVVEKKWVLKRPIQLPWASGPDIDHIANHYSNFGKRVGVGAFEVNVHEYLGEGKSGVAFLATVVKPKSRAGETAVLKVNHQRTVLESTAREAQIMEAARGVPHASQFMAFGKLWIPSGFFGSAWPDYRYVEGLLMTAAPGDELKSSMPLDGKSVGKIKVDLQKFANAMYKRDLLHGDLNPSNVFWDGKDATVIDFGNGQNLKEQPKRTQDFGVRMLLQDAKYEMRRFFSTYLDSQ